MLNVRVVSQLGRPIVAPIEARFGPAGGTIGRSPECTLVLPDPGRHISREQARIAASGARFVLTCLGNGNTILLNGAELGPGDSAPVAHGDSVIIAEYELRIEDAASAPARSVLADDFDPFATPGASDAASHRPAAGRVPAASAPPPAAASARDDLFAGLGGPAAPLADRLADPLGLDPAPRAAPAPMARADANDPLGLASGQNVMIDASRRAADSIDDLFGLGAPAGRDPLGVSSPLAQPLAQPNTAASADPLESLSKPPAVAPEPRADRGSELSGAFRLPEVLPDTNFGLPLNPDGSAKAVPAPPPSAAGASPGPQVSGAALNGTLSGAFKSWQNPTELPRSVTVSRIPGDSTLSGEVSSPLRPAGEVPALEPGEVRSIAERVADAYRGEFESPPKTRPTALLNEMNRAQVEALRADGARARGGGRAAEAGGDGAADESFELLKQLLLGLGLAALPSNPITGGAQPPLLTPELARRIGELLKVSTQGTIDLLRARSTLKREMKSEVTMIAARDNNPLKFSPDAQAALAQLLSTHSVRGFMDPVPALRDAYDDLLAHQVGFVAGMRAAMQGLIERFDPAVLEARLTKKSVIDSMLPMARRARLWELFNEMFAEISREAEDDFEALFGREFVRAYEEQIDRLRDKQP